MSLVAPSAFCSALIFLLNPQNTVYPYFFHCSYQLFFFFFYLLFNVFILVLPKSGSSHLVTVLGMQCVLLSTHQNQGIISVSQRPLS